MKNMISSLFENSLEDIPEKIDEIKYSEEDTDKTYNENYTEAIKLLTENYKVSSESVREIAINISDEFQMSYGAGKENFPEKSTINIHAFAINPSIPLIDKTKLSENIKNIAEKDIPKENDEIEAINKLIPVMRINSHIDYENRVKSILLSRQVEIKDISYDIVFSNISKCHDKILDICHDMYDIHKIAINEVQQASNLRTLNVILGVIGRLYRIYRAYAGVYAIAAMELMLILKPKALNESASEEDATQYVNELNKLIPEIRKFYDEFKYKEIVIPRKKKIEKMNEYMIGALDKKYKLKIPIYKVIGKSSDVKDIIENQFIKPIEKIVHKYPNYIVMSPNFSDDSDMFIYITLKEPFGDKEDRDNREDQSKDALNETVIYEASLTAA